MLRGMNETSNVSPISTTHTPSRSSVRSAGRRPDNAMLSLMTTSCTRTSVSHHIRGRACTVKLFRSLQGKGRFEVKTHRIAVNGASVLTERN